MQGFENEAGLEEFLSRPFEPDIAAVQQHPGDFVILGAGGKMGPTLAMRIKRAVELAGTSQRVIAVSRFSEERVAEALRKAGIEIHGADLLDRDAMANLPHAENILYLAGRKFGSGGNPSLTWAMNVLLPERVATRYPDAKIVALSSGNIYPLLPADSGGATETTPPGPVGEYAQTVLGRERVFEYCSTAHGTRVVSIRLNYAVEPRYGVLADLAAKVFAGEPIDLTMPAVNVVWQGDANSVVLRALALCSSPPAVLNLTGPSTLSVRDLANAFGPSVRFTGTESPTALLNDASRCWDLFGPPQVTIEQMIEWTAAWHRRGLRTLGKPTHFEAREGKF